MLKKIYAVNIHEPDKQRYVMFDSADSVASFISAQNEDLLFKNSTGADMFSTNGPEIDKFFMGGEYMKDELIEAMRKIHANEVEVTPPFVEIQKPFKVVVTETITTEFTTFATTKESSLSHAKELYEEKSLPRLSWTTSKTTYDAVGKEETLRALFIKPDAMPREIKVLNDKYKIQDLFDGDISVVTPFKDDPNICVITSKYFSEYDSKNRGIKDARGNVTNIFYNNMMIARKHGAVFESLTDEDIKKYSKMFSKKHMFYMDKAGSYNFKERRIKSICR